MANEDRTMSVSGTGEWDSIASRFAPKVQEDIPANVADNILIGWPPIVGFLEDNLESFSGSEILDYGCGGGQFAAELTSRGAKVTGVDTSPVMIENAKKTYGESVSFVVADSEGLGAGSYFDAIVSVMVFQFISNIEKSIEELSKLLKPNGLLIFAVHNQRYVSDWIKETQKYSGFADSEHPTDGYLNFDEDKVKIHIRPSRTYITICQRYGLEHIAELLPPYTKEYLSKYDSGGPTRNPEFLILGFRKQSE